MSPILVRPVREQLEHDRVIRALQAKFRRKFEVAVNIGVDQSTPIRMGGLMAFPDLVLTSMGRGARLAGVVEVETGESVNNLEALAQWAHLSRAKVPFSLYVPAGSVDIARRLSADNQIPVDEIWSYHPLGAQIRFTLVHRAPAARTQSAASRARSASARRSRPVARTGVPRAKTRPAAKPKSRTKTVARKKASQPARSRKR